MKIPDPTKALNALSQPNRLALFEAIAASESGLTTTQAAKAAGTLLNTAAVNLTVLEAAGLISSKKTGRSVTHTANLAKVRILGAYLSQIGN
jgi:predicted transcriptional regulator